MEPGFCGEIPKEEHRHWGNPSAPHPRVLCRDFSELDAAAAGSSLLYAESFSLAVTVLGPREGFFPRGLNAKLQLCWAWRSQAGLDLPLWQRWWLFLVLMDCSMPSAPGQDTWHLWACTWPGKGCALMAVFISSIMVFSTAPVGSRADLPASPVSVPSAGRHHISHQSC